MDKQFWQRLVQNEYAVPKGHSLEELTAELFSYLGNTDPDLRDDIGYIVYANWLEMGLYSQETILEQISQLTDNLETGIGEQDTNSVFLRSFSVLFLAEIIYNDNKAPKLDKATIDTLVEKALWYLEHEKDPRGYTQDKGWAHALAHTADLLFVLAENKHTSSAQHLRILNGITEKLETASDWVYVHGEDDRLSRAVLAIFRRGLVSSVDVQEWLSSFTEKWKGAWTNDERTRAFANTRNFIRSLYLQVATEKDLSDQDELEKMILNAIQMMKPY
jgi:hypothetical protein